MLSGQRKPGQVVIKKDIVFPGNGIVATAATVAQIFSVGIIFEMTAYAFDRRDLYMGGLFVTCLA